MKYKILSFIILAIFIGAMFWVVPIFKERYFQNNSGKKEIFKSTDESTVDYPSLQNDSPTENNSETNSENISEAGQNDEEIADIQIESVNLTPQENENTLAHITVEHCNSGCQAFANNFEYLEYCEQVCGISPAKDVSQADCEDKKDLAKDYCWKDLAISKKDFSLCNKIEDSNVKETCKNRITQNIIEGN